MTMTTTRHRAAGRIAAGLCAAAGLAVAAWAQTPSPSPTVAPKGAAMSGRAAGAFDVKLTPGLEDKESAWPDDRRQAVSRGSGGTGRGEMLSFLSAVQGPRSTSPSSA
jgi:hypothetical protein